MFLAEWTPQGHSGPRLFPSVGSSSSISRLLPLHIEAGEREKEERNAWTNFTEQARKWLTSPPPTFCEQELPRKDCREAREHGECRPGMCPKGHGRNLATYQILQHIKNLYRFISVDPY